MIVPGRCCVWEGGSCPETLICAYNIPTHHHRHYRHRAAHNAAQNRKGKSVFAFRVPTDVPPSCRFGIASSASQSRRTYPLAGLSSAARRYHHHRRRRRRWLRGLGSVGGRASGPCRDSGSGCGVHGCGCGCGCGGPGSGSCSYPCSGSGFCSDFCSGFGCGSVTVKASRSGNISSPTLSADLSGLGAPESRRPCRSVPPFACRASRAGTGCTADDAPS